MICRKFPDSYNKETSRHHISSSDQTKIAVTCRSCGAKVAVVLTYLSTTYTPFSVYVLVHETCFVSPACL